MPVWLEKILSLVVGKTGDTEWHIGWSFDLPLFKNTGGSMDYEAMAKDLTAKLQKVKGEFANVKTLNDALAVIPDVVALVESECASLAGVDKKKLVITVLDGLITVPFVPEAVENMLFSWAIAAIVSALNKLLGADWLAKLKLA